MVNPVDLLFDLNQIGSDGYAPLHQSCSLGNESIVRYLLFKKNVDPNVRGKDEWVPLEMACWFDKPRIVDLLLKEKKTKLNVKHPVRGSCLHLSAKKNNFQICQMLLMQGIDVGITNKEGKRAVDVTKSKKIIDIIKKYESGIQKSSIQESIGNLNAISEEDQEEEEKFSSPANSLPISNSIDSADLGIDIKSRPTIDSNADRRIEAMSPESTGLLPDESITHSPSSPGVLDSQGNIKISSASRAGSRRPQSKIA
jgi:ankyrin repeat protein